jgi:hypothetical protein
MKKTRFDLEQDIMASWQTANDLELAYKFIAGGAFFKGMDSKHENKIANFLLGIHEMHEMRMNRLWSTFETLLEQGAFTDYKGSYNED